MNSLQVGTSFNQYDWCNAQIKCGDILDVACSEFIDDGTGITVYFLYNATGCDYISKSNLVISIKPSGSTKWKIWETYEIPENEGFTYKAIEIIDGTNNEFKVTYKEITKYFNVIEYCPEIDCYEISLEKNQCYQGDTIYVEIINCFTINEDVNWYHEWFIDGIQIDNNTRHYIIQTNNLSIGEHTISARALTYCGTSSELLSTLFIVDNPSDYCDETTCDNYTLYSLKGVWDTNYNTVACIKDVLLKENSIECGYEESEDPEDPEDPELEDTYYLKFVAYSTLALATIRMLRD